MNGSRPRVADWCPFVTEPSLYRLSPSWRFRRCGLYLIDHDLKCYWHIGIHFMQLHACGGVRCRTARIHWFNLTWLDLIVMHRPWLLIFIYHPHWVVRLRGMHQRKQINTLRPGDIYLRLETVMTGPGNEWCLPIPESMMIGCRWDSSK